MEKECGVASWLQNLIKQTFLGECKLPSSPMNNNQSNLPKCGEHHILRLPSDGGDGGEFSADQHSPRPHEAPSDFRAWSKLSLGKPNSNVEVTGGLKAALEVAPVLFSGTRRSSISCAAMPPNSEQCRNVERFRRGSCPNFQ